MKKIKYRKREPGEAIRLNLDEESWKVACCDCGSVHLLQFHHIEDNVWDFAYFPDKRATGQLRRYNYGFLQQDGKF